MKRFDSFLLKIFLYGLPAAIILAAFTHFYGLGTENQANAYLTLLNDITGFICAIWMTLSLYLSFRLIVSSPFRDQVLAKLTFIRERDERESILTGQAARTTFLTTLAVLILLLCLSCFQISVYRVPPEKAVDGKTGFVTLGLGFDLWGQSEQHGSKDTIEAKNFFSYTGLPVSTTTVILLLIAWQIIFYNYSMRRLVKT